LWLRATGGEPPAEGETVRPPVWLEQSDESWGPPELRKRRTPISERVHRRGAKRRHFDFFTILLIFIAAGAILVLGLYGWALISRLLGK
jgi:hypothetical protein